MNADEYVRLRVVKFQARSISLLVMLQHGCSSCEELRMASMIMSVDMNFAENFKEVGCHRLTSGSQESTSQRSNLKVSKVQ